MTCGAMNLGKKLSMAAPLITSEVNSILRFTQSGSRPKGDGISRKRTDGNGDIHRGRPTNALLAVLLTIRRTVLSAGTLFHSNYSWFEQRVETSGDEPQLTMTFEIQNLVKSRDDLIFDVGVYEFEIMIDSRAEDRNMVWIIVNIMPQCVLKPKNLLHLSSG